MVAADPLVGSGVEQGVDTVHLVPLALPALTALLLCMSHIGVMAADLHVLRWWVSLLVEKIQEVRYTPDSSSCLAEAFFAFEDFFKWESLTWRFKRSLLTSQSKKLSVDGRMIDLLRYEY
jgi:hypothetical protein